MYMSINSIEVRIHLDYKFNLRLRNFIINSSILDTSLRYGMVSPTQVGGNFYTNWQLPQLKVYHAEADVINPDYFTGLETVNVLEQMKNLENMANIVIEMKTLFAAEEKRCTTESTEGQRYKKASIHWQDSTLPISGYWSTSEPNAG